MKYPAVCRKHVLSNHAAAESALPVLAAWIEGDLSECLEDARNHVAGVDRIRSPCLNQRWRVAVLRSSSPQTRKGIRHVIHTRAKVPGDTQQQQTVVAVPDPQMGRSQAPAVEGDVQHREIVCPVGDFCGIGEAVQPDIRQSETFQIGRDQSPDTVGYSVEVQQF